MLELNVAHPAAGPSNHLVECREVFGMDTSNDPIKGPRNIYRVKFEELIELP